MPQINYFNDNSGAVEENLEILTSPEEGAALMGLTEEGMKLYGLKLKSDPVNSPSHYTQGGIECIEAIKASMTHEEFCGYLKGCAIKYLWRYKHKGKPVEDLKKAAWYQDRLIKEEESK